MRGEKIKDQEIPIPQQVCDKISSKLNMLVRYVKELIRKFNRKKKFLDDDSLSTSSKHSKLKFLKQKAKGLIIQRQYKHQKKEVQDRKQEHAWSK